MARSPLIKSGLGLQKKGGMSGPRIRPPSLAVSAKVGMAKGKGFGVGGSPSTIASPPALSKSTQDVAEQKFAGGGRVRPAKGVAKKGKR